MTDLLPCPFCDSKDGAGRTWPPLLTEGTYNDHGPCVAIVCTNFDCGAKIEELLADHTDAEAVVVARWNVRVFVKPERAKEIAKFNLDAAKREWMEQADFAICKIGKLRWWQGRKARDLVDELLRIRTYWN